MLPRSQRLNVREFAVVFEKSQVLRDPLLQLRFYHHAADDPGSAISGAQKKRCRGKTRAAFVAPKKLGNAVVRNAIRRRVRERYRLFRAQASNQNRLHRARNWNEALENCDLVFLASAQCSAATSEQIDES